MRLCWLWACRNAGSPFTWITSDPKKKRMHRETNLRISSQQLVVCKG
jgi:hypothetical protein